MTIIITIFFSFRSATCWQLKTMADSRKLAMCVRWDCFSHRSHAVFLSLFSTKRRGAPALRNRRTQSTSPLTTATCNAVLPTHNTATHNTFVCCRHSQLYHYSHPPSCLLFYIFLLNYYYFFNYPRGYHFLGWYHGKESFFNFTMTSSQVVIFLKCLKFKDTSSKQQNYVISYFANHKSFCIVFRFN